MSEYSEELRRILWNRLTKISGKDPKSYRLDAAGALIEWDDYDVHADKNVVDGKTNYIVNREVQKNIQKHYQLPLYLFGDRNVIVTLPRKKY